MKNLSGQESLWVALPILIVIVLLIAGLIFLPRVQTELRSKASEPAPSIVTPTPKLSPGIAPEIVCSALYSPVCGVNGRTYSNACEANLAGVTSFIEGRCTAPKTTVTKAPSIQYYLPSTN